MKKVIAFFGILCLFINSLNAQITFEKSYKKLVQEEIAVSCDVTQDGGYVVAVGEKLLHSTMRKEAIIKLNGFGDTVFHKSYQIQTNVGNTQLIKSAKDGGYFLAGVREDSSGDHQYMLWLMKADSLGNKIWTKNYTNSLLNAYPEGNILQILPNGNIFMSLYNRNILRVNNDGILDTLTTVPFFTNTSTFYKKNIINYNDHFYYIGGNLTNNRLAKIDTLGLFSINSNLVFQLDTGLRTIDILKIVGADYYICSFSQPLINGEYPFMLSKFDSSGAKVWNKFFTTLHLNSIKPSAYKTLANGTNILSILPGNTGVQSPTGHSALFCFNDYGDSLWYKQLSPSDTSAKTEIFDVIATPDSGLLAVGQIVFSNGQQKSYMIKLDANGNLFNPMKIVERKKETYLHVYPNPATNYTGLHYMGIEKNALLTISDLQGKQVFSKQLETNEERIYIDTSVLDAGFYICSISVNGEKLTSKKLVVIN